MAKFSLNSDGPATVYADGQPVRFEAGGTYETDDPVIVRALRENPFVSEVKTKVRGLKTK